MAHHHDSDHDDFGGLHRDLAATTAMQRREMLRVMLGVGVFTVMGCGNDNSTGTGNTSDQCSVIPEETEGPYPGDGSNGPDVLGQSGVVRSDIRSSFAGLSGTAEGVLLTLNLTVISASTCEPLAGYAVYAWHCDREGRYSLYSAGATDQNYLRGVQQADADGKLSFTTIFPACYAGRWPHIHFEVYPSLDAATSVSSKVRTSQLALPKSVCDQVYAQAGYEQSVTNLSHVSLATDGIFSDGSALQVPSVSGDVASGYIASLTVAV